MSSTFQIGALVIIVPLAAAFLLGCLCICRHKIYLMTLKQEDSESDAGPKIAEARIPKKVVTDNADKYVAPEDPVAGRGRGAESESDSILMADSGKGATRKSFCA